VIVAVIAALEEQLELVESELRRYARADRRCQALETIFDVGPILACHLLAEIGEARRFQRPRQLVRAGGLDPSVLESAESKRRGRLAKQGSRHLRWALVEAANHSHRHTSPDHHLDRRTVRRCGRGRARLTVARKIARRSYHVLLERKPPDLPTTPVRTTKAQTIGDSLRRAPSAPGRPACPSRGMSRRRNPNQTSCAASARADLGSGRRTPRTPPTRPPPLASLAPSI